MDVLEVSINGASPISSIYRWDFPEQKPSIFGCPQKIGPPHMIYHGFWQNLQKTYEAMIETNEFFGISHFFLGEPIYRTLDAIKHGWKTTSSMGKPPQISQMDIFLGICTLEKGYVAVLAQ